MKHCQEYNINREDYIFWSECQIWATTIKPFVKHLLKVNAAGCPQDRLL